MERVEREVAVSVLLDYRRNHLQKLLESGVNGVTELKEFIESQNDDSIVLQGLSGSERCDIHHLCELYDLVSKSTGPKSQRILTISKTKIACEITGSTDASIKIQETYCFQGYIGIKGSFVTCVAQRNIAHIPTKMVRTQQARDNYTYHITIINKRELALLYSQQKSNFDSLKAFAKSILLRLTNEIPDDWEDKGLGHLEDCSSECYFRVIDWPAANALRLSLGLEEASFHITVGFSPGDIHNVSKGHDTIIIPHT